MFKKIKAFFKFIGYILLTIVVFVSVYSFIYTQVLKNDYVNLFGYSFFTVKSGSMTGTIEVNDFIVVKVCNDVKENDVITFIDNNGSIVTHRYIKTVDNKIITQGDANNAQDDPITKDSVIGKVIYIFSPTFAVKCVAVILIIGIFLVLINFDQLIKKFILDEEEVKVDHNKFPVLPEDVFSAPKAKGEYKSSGLTVSIPVEDIERMNKLNNEEALKEDIEVLEDVIDVDSNKIISTEKKSRKDKEKEFIDLVVSLLRIKNDSLKTTKINKNWLQKYQYVYELVHIINIGDTKSLIESVNSPSFKEIYDYDLDKIGLYENLRNRLYEMPIYIFLRVLCFAVLYNDEEFFDGVFKIMKYKILIDSNNYFREIKKDDSYSKKQLKSLICFMQKIPDTFDNKNVFELERIEKLVQIKGYVNE